MDSPRVVVTDYMGKSYILGEALADPPSHWFYKGAPNLLYRNRFAEVLASPSDEKWSSTRATVFAIQPFACKADSS